MTDCAPMRGRGAAKGNKHALKTGQHTREARNFRRGVRAQIARAHALIALASPNLSRLRERTASRSEAGEGESAEG
jgi:hypothetical protein